MGSNSTRAFQQLSAGNSGQLAMNVSTEGMSLAGVTGSSVGKSVYVGDKSVTGKSNVA